MSDVHGQRLLHGAIAGVVATGSMTLMIVADAVYGLSLSITARYLILPNDVEPA